MTALDALPAPMEAQLEPRLVVAVQYDHVSDRRFRHGAKFPRWRPGKSPRQCTLAPLEAPP